MVRTNPTIEPLMAKVTRFLGSPLYWAELVHDVPPSYPRSSCGYCDYADSSLLPSARIFKLAFTSLSHSL